MIEDGFNKIAVMESSVVDSLFSVTVTKTNTETKTISKKTTEDIIRCIALAIEDVHGCSSDDIENDLWALLTMKRQTLFELYPADKLRAILELFNTPKISEQTYEETELELVEANGIRGGTKEIVNLFFTELQKIKQEILYELGYKAGRAHKPVPAQKRKVHKVLPTKKPRVPTEKLRVPIQKTNHLDTPGAKEGRLRLRKLLVGKSDLFGGDTSAIPLFGSRKDLQSAIEKKYIEPISNSFISSVLHGHENLSAGLAKQLLGIVTPASDRETYINIMRECFVLMNKKGKDFLKDVDITIAKEKIVTTD